MYLENPKDEIRIEQLEVYAYHGVFPEEKRKGQTFLVNAVLYTSTRKAGQADQLEQSTDYGDVCCFIIEWMKENTCNLIEAVAERLTQTLLLRYDLISDIDLEIRKPEAPIEHPFGCVSVKIHRGWHRVYLSAGSNMGDKKQYIQDAVEALKAHPLIVLRRVSDLIVTKPYGGVEQEDFLNGAIDILGVLVKAGLTASRSEARRAVEQGGVTVDNEKVADIKTVYTPEVFTGDGIVVRRGKKSYKRVVM